MGIVPDTCRAHGFIFRIFYRRRHIEIVNAICGNPEAEISTTRRCNYLCISVININTIIRFASALVALDLDDFSGLMLTDGEIARLPYVLPYLFCQRCSSCNCVVIQLGHQLIANTQFLYA